MDVRLRFGTNTEVPWTSAVDMAPLSEYIAVRKNFGDKRYGYRKTEPEHQGKMHSKYTWAGTTGQGGTMKKQNTVSHQEIHAALQKFVRDGGLIKKLPEQSAKRRDVLGEDKYEMYEAVSNLPIIN